MRVRAKDEEHNALATRRGKKSHGATACYEAKCSAEFIPRPIAVPGDSAGFV